MKKICNFNRKNNLLLIVYFLPFLFIGIDLFFNYDSFDVNFLLTGRVMRPVGLFVMFYSGIAILWVIVLLMRTNPALIITDDYFIDNIRYKSLGKIYYSEITGIKIIFKDTSNPLFKRKKIKYLRIALKNPIEPRLNFMDKFYLKFFPMEDELENNIYLNSGLLKDCDLDELKKIISSNIKRIKK